MSAETVSDIMSHTIVSIEKGCSLTKAVSIMVQKNIGSIVVTEEDNAVGIVTEREIVLTVREADDLRDVLVEEVMSPVVHVSPDTRLQDALEVMRNQRLNRLLVMEDNKLAGIVTTRDLVHGMNTPAAQTHVGDIMVHEVVTVHRDCSVFEADTIMASIDIAGETPPHKIDALLVLKDDVVAGIFTERDVMKLVAKNKDFKETLIGDMMSKNITTIHPDVVVYEAIHFMESGGFRHLPVVEQDGKLVGLVGLHDLLRALQDHYRDSS